MHQTCPRLVLAALRGGSGKTTLTLGLLAAWRWRGREVVPFKKGPDYIDPAWHALAAGRPCYNLDPYLMDKDKMLASIAYHTRDADGALIEGNRGLYDGLDVTGTYSTAELAKILKAPVVLVVDCSMTTRTAAALVMGCQKFDPAVELCGVILNQVARPRHEALLRAAIEQYCGLPVLGAIPRMKCAVFPERHMGLVPPPEHSAARKAVAAAQELGEKYLDLEQLWQLAQQAPELPEGNYSHSLELANSPQEVVLGIVRDSAFQFYYPENLEALAQAGACLVEINALTDRALSPVDGLYIGGGFPETNARALAENISFRRELRQAIDNGLPVYAECGGMMYLGERLLVAGETFPMVGVLPLTFTMGKKPQGHGYTTIIVDQTNPFFSVGTRLLGHEFHYSRVEDLSPQACQLVFHLDRGHGLINQRDGVVYKNVLATYTHLHALATPEWAVSLVNLARKYRDSRQQERRSDVHDHPPLQILHRQ